MDVHSEMVERVARAIYEAKRLIEGVDSTWDEVKDRASRPDGYAYAKLAYDASTKAARAAIEAMMDLDGKMWVAGRDEFVKQADRFNAADRHEMASAIADRAPEHIAKAMLSEALSPSLKEQERT